MFPRKAGLILFPTLILVGFFGASRLTSAPPSNPLTNGSFEELTPEGFPVDWEAVGTTVKVTHQAHTGQWALHFQRGPEAPPETGLNRAWQVESGEQGAMLAETSGGITFWYQAPRSDRCQMAVVVIPMSSRPLEDTGEPRAQFLIPEEHVGDGQWHPGTLKYDYRSNPKVRWVHVGVRLTGGAGELLVDDFQYVPHVGPLLRVSDLRLMEEAARPGEQGTLTAKVTNVGDEPAANVTAQVWLPTPLSTPAATQNLGALAVDTAQTVSWKIEGTRLGGSYLRVEAASGDRTASASLALEPHLRLVSFLTDRFLLAPGEATTLRAMVENRGTAFATAVRGQLQLKPAVHLQASAGTTLERLAPGAQAEMAWNIAAGPNLGRSTVGLKVWEEGRKREAKGSDSSLEGKTQLILTSALRAPAHQLVRSLWYRVGPDRSVGEICLQHQGKRRAVARMPWLARVVYADPAGHPTEVVPRQIRRRELRYLAELTSSVRDRNGGTWTFSIRSSHLPGRTIPYTVQVTCDQPRRLLAFEGPLLYVGEGLTGAVRTEGLFPGLEWLVEGEVSSSTLDIAEGHPDQVRYVPHPHKVTIPLMAVQITAPLLPPIRACIGLFWDVHQQWDGLRDRPQPIFASPDRFEGCQAHLLGLMTPNVLTGLKENERHAQEPYLLKAGQKLTLQSQIFVDPTAKDALAAMDRWFSTYRPDPPLPPPQGDYTKQVEFSMRAYLESLWISEKEGWLPFQGGPALWRNPTRDPSFCFDLLMGARITPDATQAWQYRARAEEQLALGRAQAAADDLGFGSGNLARTVLSLAAQAGSLMDGQGEDGAWRFDADRQDMGVFKGLDYHELGADNAAELGTCARNAYEILRYARISGDAEAYAAGVRALEFMRQFTVPRAAQVWEVPVHSPDILAAADAIDAYLEAYRFSGEKRWLAEARRWARAGLPFVYVWNAPGQPWMRYGSIPVFGASWNQYSWFGVLVQWNGLRYAYALLKLHTYDPRPPYGSFTWHDVAVGITHSAMYQQSEKPENIALWPDSYNCLTGTRAAWDFAPRMILKNVYTLLGREEEPQTVVLRTGLHACHLTSGAVIEQAVWEGDCLEIDLRYPPQEDGYTLLTGLARPTEVQLDGASLSEREDLEAGSESGWHYDSSYGFLTVRVAHDGPAHLTVRGVRPERRQLLPTRITTLDFEFEGDAEGWLAANDLSPLAVRNGVLTTTALGGDPYMVRSRCHLDGDTIKAVLVRLRVNRGQTGQFYWTTLASPSYAEDKVVHFELIADGQWHEYRLPVGDHPLWHGHIITGLRLDPGNAGAGAEVGVDWLRGE